MNKIEKVWADLVATDPRWADEKGEVAVEVAVLKKVVWRAFYLGCRTSPEEFFEMLHSPAEMDRFVQFGGKHG